MGHRGELYPVNDSAGCSTVTFLFERKLVRTVRVSCEELPGANFWDLFVLGEFIIPFALARSNPAQESKSAEAWHFAVSGDSRNCGDVVMPAIAEKVRTEHAAFYWHLGDYRAIYDFDQDIKARNPTINVITYESSAWKDFIDRQLKPFGDLPVYLALGNHELIPPKTRTDALLQFADWYNAPELSKQRLADDPSDHELRAYYHWGLGKASISLRSITRQRISLTMHR